MVSRRRLLSWCGVVSVGGLSGCSGNPFRDPADAKQRTPDTADVKRRTPDIADAKRRTRDIADAKRRALSAEEEHIRRQLTNASCVDNWSLQAVGVIKDASVTKTTDDAVYVEVRHPYSFNINGRYADIYSDSTYAVRTDAVERTEGTPITPC